MSILTRLSTEPSPEVLAERPATRRERERFRSALRGVYASR